LCEVEAQVCAAWWPEGRIRGEQAHRAAAGTARTLGTNRPGGDRVSQQQTLAALKALAEAGVIRQLSEGMYDRQYAATELFDLLGAYEERVFGPARSAGPTG
jgi:hypothetical protein